MKNFQSKVKKLNYKSHTKITTESVIWRQKQTSPSSSTAATLTGKTDLTIKELAYKENQRTVHLSLLVRAYKYNLLKLTHVKVKSLSLSNTFSRDIKYLGLHPFFSVTS